jgi:hypothetical protein
LRSCTLQAIGYKPKHTLRFALFANEERLTEGPEVQICEEAKAKGGNIFFFALERVVQADLHREVFSAGRVKNKNDKVTGWLPCTPPYGVFEFTSV